MNTIVIKYYKNDCGIVTRHLNISDMSILDSAKYIAGYCQALVDQGFEVVID
tara:strand:- start:348 stop:503 length:156 start_codon:yes stop_codon:yes gene_type:complete